MNERDIRQAAYDDCTESKGGKLVVVNALMTGLGLLVAFVFGRFGFYFGCMIGLVFIAFIGHNIYFSRKNLKKKREIIMRGILTEAEVVELKQKKDFDDDLITVAVYKFTLPGGEERRFKKPVNSSITGLLGAIQVGAKFNIFVDPNNPLNYHLAYPKLTDYAPQELAQMPGIQGSNSRLLKHLQEKRGIDPLFIPPQKRKSKMSQWADQAVVFMLIVIPFAVLTGIISLLMPNMNHDPIDLPFGAYISSIGTTEVYQYFPETNEWSYYLDDFGVTQTKEWRFDSQCSEPMWLKYDFSFVFRGHLFTEKYDTPDLLIPESYRERLDEFIKDGEDTSSTIP